MLFHIYPMNRPYIHYDRERRGEQRDLSRQREVAMPIARSKATRHAPLTFSYISSPQRFFTPQSMLLYRHSQLCPLQCSSRPKAQQFIPNLLLSPTLPYKSLQPALPPVVRLGIFRKEAFEPLILPSHQLPSCSEPPGMVSVDLEGQLAKETRMR